MHPAACWCPVYQVTAISPYGLWKKDLSLFADPCYPFHCLFLALPFSREGEAGTAWPQHCLLWGLLGRALAVRVGKETSRLWSGFPLGRQRLCWCGLLACPHIHVLERWPRQHSPTAGSRNLSPWLCISTSLIQLPAFWLWHTQSHTCLPCHVSWWMLAYTRAGAGCQNVAGHSREGKGHHLKPWSSGAGEKKLMFSKRAVNINLSSVPKPVPEALDTIYSICISKTTRQIPCSSWRLGSNPCSCLWAQPGSANTPVHLAASQNKSKTTLTLQRGRID